ncbi:hypothetical protein Nepgr_025582 [Nepenthes gracilis]|uniref:Uncharacterized protein n=1 Tax=Nepenthes gracilis TaxID=150966 RepID=A0AAD3T6N4_NEPGR|nr:hypothetical protein Nepgr_025582 [Nepenthes gracilis]
MRTLGEEVPIHEGKVAKPQGNLAYQILGDPKDAIFLSNAALPITAAPGREAPAASSVFTIRNHLFGSNRAAIALKCPSDLDDRTIENSHRRFIGLQLRVTNTHVAGHTTNSLAFNLRKKALQSEGSKLQELPSKLRHHSPSNLHQPLRYAHIHRSWKRHDPQHYQSCQYNL